MDVLDPVLLTTKTKRIARTLDVSSLVSCDQRKERKACVGRSDYAPRIASAYTHTATDGRTYYLHRKTIMFPGGRRQPLYTFARRPRPDETLDAVPAGYRVTESAWTRRPYLRKV